MFGLPWSTVKASEKILAFLEENRIHVLYNMMLYNFYIEEISPVKIVLENPYMPV